MEDLGRQLKRAREARGVSLREIATRTKISISALEALERSEFHRLPGGIFSRAVVRAYATEVGLDPDITVENFLTHASRHERETAERVAAAMPGVTNDDREFLDRQKRALRILQVVAVLLAVGAITLLGWQMRRVWAPEAPDSPPEPEMSLAPPPPPPPPPATIPETAETLPPPATPSPVTESPASGRSGSDPAGAAPAPEATAPVATAVDRAAANPAPVTGPPVQAETAAVPPAAPVATTLVVELTAATDCEITSARDGGPAETYLLRAGTRYRLEAARDLVLTVADAGAVSWTINGKRAQPLGKPGAEVRVLVTPANAADFLR
jgi:cytoskeleton protein RodZ